MMNVTFKIKHKHGPQGRNCQVARVDKEQEITIAEGPISLSQKIVICTRTENHPRFERIRKNLTIATHHYWLVYLIETAFFLWEIEY